MFSIVETTTNDIKVAELIRENILNKKLSPCIQIISDISSSYIWNNKITTDNEYLVKIKAKSSNIKDITALINKLHNYDNPELISYIFTIESNKYKSWFIENSY